MRGQSKQLSRNYPRRSGVKYAKKSFYTERLGQEAGTKQTRSPRQLTIWVDSGIFPDSDTISGGVLNGSDLKTQDRDYVV